MINEYESPWGIRARWLYLLAVVAMLMTPVFYNFYISFNEYGFGAARYSFTLGWYAAVFHDSLLKNAFGWTALLAVITTTITIPMGLATAKLFKRSRRKGAIVALMLLPLFVPADIFASSMLVFFKSLHGAFAWLAAATGIGFLSGAFRLGVTTAVIGLVIYTLPYVFIVILITMGRYNPEQTEAARSCGATAWQAFRDVEFPQIRPGVLASCAFAVILVFNEYTRTAMLKGGFDTFTTVLVSQMLNTGMSEQSYAMGGIVSGIAIAVIGTIIVATLVRAERLERARRARAAPVMSG